MATPIEQRYIEQHPGSAERFARAEDIFPDGVTHDARRQRPFALYYTHAEGPAKYDVDGHRILDYFPGHGALILGHSHPDIVAAVSDQMAKGTHFSGSTDLEMRWGEWVQGADPQRRKSALSQLGHRGRHDGHPDGAGVHRQDQGDQVRAPLPRLERLPRRRKRGYRRHPERDTEHHDRPAAERHLRRRTDDHGERATLPPSSSNLPAPTWACTRSSPASSASCAR